MAKADGQAPSVWLQVVMAAAVTVVVGSLAGAVLARRRRRTGAHRWAQRLGEVALAASVLLSATFGVGLALWLVSVVLVGAGLAG